MPPRVVATRNTRGASYRTVKGWASLMLLVMLFCMTAPALAADLVTNGGYDGATGWTFGGNGLYSTAQDNGVLTGAGSFEATVTGRKTGLSATASQAVSVLAGGTINSVSLYGMHTWGTIAPDPVTVTVTIRYADATTADIFSANLPLNSSWASLGNDLAGTLPLTVAQNVNTVTVTVTGKNGNDAAATQSAFIDDVIVDYTGSATDSLTVTSSVNVSTTAQPAQTDVQMMYMQLNSDATGNGNCVVTDVTLNDTFIGTTGTIQAVQVHLDDDNNFLNGTLGSNTITPFDGLSTVVDLTSVDLTLAERTITSGSPKFIWLLYDIDPGSSTGIQAQLQVTDVGVVAPDIAPISGPWDSNVIDINTGLGCGGCHPNPMVDGVARDPLTGGVEGDHTKHASAQGYECELCHLATPLTPRHRNSFVELRAAIGDVANARYDKDGDHAHDSSWDHTTTPIRGNCENTNCHGGINSATSYGGPTGSGPQWGTNNADTCTFCHNANQTNAGGTANSYPTASSPFRSLTDVGAHAVHMAGTSGIMSGGVLCADCHVVPAAITDAGHMDELAVAPYTQAPADVPFPAGSDALLTSYPAVYYNATISCDVYCHSAFDAAAADTKGTNTFPVWTDDWSNYAGDTACATACHLVPPQTATHDKGGSVYYGLTECNGCHNTSTTDTGNPPTMGAAHINGSIDATGCTGCHGTDPKQYPPVSPTQGGSDGLGAHVVHIEQTGSIMTKEVNEGTTANDWCAECHTSTRGAGSHDDAYPAEVAFTNAIEAKYGSTSASIVPDASGASDGNAGDCTVYCHGANMPKGDTSGNNRIPDWADTTYAGVCDNCHGAPPTAGSSASAHSGKAFPTSCITCHPDTVLDTANPPTLAASFHINGTVEASGCNGCHGGDNATWSNNNFWPSAGGAYPKRAGEHEVHINALMSQLGYTPGTITDVQQQGLCDYCHNDAAGAGGTNHDDNTAPANLGSFNRIWDAAADGGGAASYTPGDGTGGSCSNIDCHNDNTTPAAFEWYDGSTTDCVMCHVAGGSGTVDPVSGVHSGSPTVSGVAHDDNFASGAGCTTCHSSMDAFMAGNHGNDADNGNAVASLGLTAGLYTQTSTAGNGSGTCSGGSVSAGSCHGIDTIDAGSWARLWDDTVSYQTGGVECAGCHGGFDGTWRFGMDTNTSDYNVSHEYDWDQAQSSSDGAEVIGNHSGSTTATRCNICHVYGDGAYVWGTNHRNRKITMNSTMGYSNSAYNCSTNCHSEGWGNTDHNLEAASSGNWATRGEDLAGPALSCTSCHGGASPSAGVDINSPHSTTSTGITCEGCHTGHTGGAVTITNNASVGINYGTGGISLGGANAPGATEQAICNGCHGAARQPWNVTQGNYTTGTLSNYSNWAAASWTSANFSSYKPTTIQSNHYDQAAGMRCSYCHDVHDTYGPNSGLGGPYLRGSWISNPFPEDGAPNTADGHVGGGLFTEDADGVPRGLGGTGIGTSNALGGWQIEQNNPGAYTRSGSYGTYAGLCQLCHPADTSASGILRGASFSGHAAAVDGLQAGGGNDIFNDTLRGAVGNFNDRAYMQHNNMLTISDSGKAYIYGLREGRAGTGIYPQVNDPTEPNVLTPWGITIGSGSGAVDADFHEFPCSKCHSPHMSALPRLMITNCLDVSHNTWDDSGAMGNPSAWSGGSYTAKTLAYSPTAANCHRYVDSTDGNRETNANGGNGEPGWNSVTPW